MKLQRTGCIKEPNDSSEHVCGTSFLSLAAYVAKHCYVLERLCFLKAVIGESVNKTKYLKYYKCDKHFKLHHLEGNESPFPYDFNGDWITKSWRNERSKSSSEILCRSS